MTLKTVKLFADVVRAVASMFRHMATAMVDKEEKDFDSIYKEALSYMSFISKDKVHRHRGEVSEIACLNIVLIRTFGDLSDVQMYRFL